MSVAMICSNSGFTADALRKAARVGIPALAALIEGDKRVRVVVRQQIYTRVIEFADHGVTFHHPALSDEQKSLLHGCYTKEWTYHGKSVEAWVAAKLMALTQFSTRSRSLLATYRLREATNFVIRTLVILVNRIDIHATFTVQWMTQVAELGASHGMYDYLRKIVLLGTGPHQFHLKNVNTETWGSPVSIDEVPPPLLVSPTPHSGPGTVSMSLAMLKNMPQSDPKDAPEIDSLVESHDVIDDQPT